MNYNVKLYREADIGGAHSGGTFNIPGLISKDIESTAKQGQAVRAAQANFGTEKVPPLASMNLSNNYLDQGQFVVGDQWNNPLNDSGWQWQQPVNPLVDPGKYKQYPWEQDPYKKYGSSPSKSQDVFDKDELLKQLARLQNPKKSAFEELIDELFTNADKEQVLIDMGYEFQLKDEGHSKKVVITRKLSDGTYKTITNTLDDLFLKEITVKFKNLLMAKASLKLKI